MLKRQSLVWILLLWSLSAYAQNPIRNKAQIKKQLLKELGTKHASRLQGDLVIKKESFEQRLKARSGDQKLSDQISSNGEELVFIKILSKGAAKSLLPELSSLGFEKSAVIGNQVTGRIPLSRLDELDQLKAVIQVQSISPNAGELYIGSVDAQGDSAMLTNVIRENFRSDGTGIKIGIISNSFNNDNGYNAAILSGDLPGPGNPNGFTTPVDIRNDFPSPGGTTDEGRAMAELIHDVAPGAELAFSNFAAFDEVDFTAAINALVAANCDIIVDDIGIFAEPYYLDGIAAQAVDNAVAQGIIYFSSAGNDGRTGFFERVGYSEADVGIGVPVFEFTNPGPNSDVSLDFQVNNQSIINIFLQWDEPWASACNGCGGAQTELDYILISDRNGFLGVSRANAIGGDAINRLVIGPGFFSYLANGETDIISVLLFRANELGFPGRVKIRNESVNLVNDPNIPFDQEPTLIGHSNAESCISVGAAWFINTPAYNPVLDQLGTAISGFDGDNNIATNTSVGGSPILFDNNGNRIAVEIRENPDLVGPDGSATTFFGLNVNGFNDPLFFGTSASAPTVAAAAAILLQASNKTYSPQQIRDVLVNTTLDMDDPYDNGLQIDPADPLFADGYDFVTGFGYVQPLVAFDQVINDVGSVAISLEEVCSENPSVERRWEFHNPNGFGLEVDISSTGGIRLPGETGFGASLRTYVVPPGKSFIWTALMRFSTFTSLTVQYEPVGSTGFGLIRKSVRGSVDGCTSSRTLASGPQPVNLVAVSELQVFPNPSADGQFSFYLESAEEDELVMQVYDISGKGFGETIKRNLVPGNNLVKIDLGKYAKGVYLLHLKSAEINGSQRLLIE